MRPLLVVLALVTAAVLAGGCVGTTPVDTYQPREREFLFKVSDASQSTVEVYEKNDGSYMRIVATGFMSPEQEDLAMPNPTIRVKEGDTVIIHVENTNNLAHTIHFHGGLIPWRMDGVDYLTQLPIMPGESFTYRFEDLKAGTYFYHCHVDGPHHQDLGMYGAFIVEEAKPPVKVDRDYIVMLDEMDSCHVHQNNDPLTGGDSRGNFGDAQTSAQCAYRYMQDNLAQNGYIGSVGGATNQTLDPLVGDAYCDPLRQSLASAPPQYRDNVLLAAGCMGNHAHGTPPPQQAPRQWWFETHPTYNPTYDTFVMNGKAFPDTQVFPVREGEKVRFRLINAGNEMHSMHWHGHYVTVIGRDGFLLDSPFKVDTLGIMPGERYDVIMTADNPGLWLFHDHVNLQTMNDHQHPGGIMACIPYIGWEGITAQEVATWRSLDCYHKAMEILDPHGGHAGHGMHTPAPGHSPTPTPAGGMASLLQRPSAMPPYVPPTAAPVPVVQDAVTGK
ncbi:MAG TPA: multicopper oxidase domain-containing protein [Candidatus Thermoplasmatota archaeon]|nr:multicopper oxidase domain-containing protein [Candidatus Thermoplasmatota archaeon]